MAYDEASLPLSPQEFRMNVVFKEQAAEISDSAVRVSQTKTVRDFNGEEYTVIECAPAGYMIYHPASGKFVETSPSAPSPYQGLSGDDLYYGGPTEYYRLVDGEYRHTVIGETFEDTDTVNVMEQASRELSDQLTASRNVALLDYVANGEQRAYATANTRHTYIGGLNADQQKWFRELKKCGYFYPGKNTSGACGFVGLNILYAFLDKFKDDKYMDDRYWIDSSKTGLISDKNKDETIAEDEVECKSFTESLYIRAPKPDGTTSMHIHKVSRIYAEDKGFQNDIQHTSLYWGLFNNGTMTDFLDGGYPVELFGSLKNPDDTKDKIQHAVVAYRYEKSSSGYKYTCHYGWDNYSDITIEGTLGSMYGIKIKYK